MKRLRKLEEKKILFGEKWIAKRSFAIDILDLVKLCSKNRKEDTAK